MGHYFSDIHHVYVKEVLYNLHSTLTNQTQILYVSAHDLKMGQTFWTHSMFFTYFFFSFIFVNCLVLFIVFVHLDHLYAEENINYSINLVFINQYFYCKKTNYPQERSDWLVNKERDR